MLSRGLTADSTANGELLDAASDNQPTKPLIQHLLADQQRDAVQFRNTLPENKADCISKPRPCEPQRAVRMGAASSTAGAQASAAETPAAEPSDGSAFKRLLAQQSALHQREAAGGGSGSSGGALAGSASGQLPANAVTSALAAAVAGTASQAPLLTNDGVQIAYDVYGRQGPIVVLIHGWSGSRHYFDLQTRALARTCRVYAYDLRFHGQSGRPTWGYHVARLAADLRDFLTGLDLGCVTLVGTSMGAAVIWSYLELFGESRVSKAVFVDQAPLQNRAEDWSLGSKGCYDAASLARMQAHLRLDFPGFAADGVAACVSKPLRPEIAEVLTRETLKADPTALSRLMADHTQLDWRPMLPRIEVPCLNLVGRQSAIFPWEGCAVVGRLIPHSHTVFFEEANHWLYLEEPDKFNALVREFALHGLPAVSKLSRV